MKRAQIPRSIAFFAVALVLLLSACTKTAQTITPNSPLPSIPPASGDNPVVAVAARVLPAVVNVTTNIYEPSPTGLPQQAKGVGTGFVVRPDGVIVTNCHVVQGASRITVFLSDRNATRFAARVIGGDCEHDLAVLKVNGDGMHTVPLGDSAALRLGQSVVAFGYALALEGGPSVTAGIVSSLDRTIEVPDPQCTVCANGIRTYSGVLQTDAAINHGNSGGPLVNMSGQVVGINSAGSDTAQNIGFAIPIDAAKTTIDHAIQDPLKATAYLGVSTRTVTADVAFQLNLPTDSGALVLATLRGGPAADAGVRVGDVIVEVNGKRVATADDLGTILDDLEPGASVDVKVVGRGGGRTVSVTLGTRPLPTEFLKP